MSGTGNGFWAGERDGLVGRDETLASLRELLDSGSRTAVVTGIPGSGKTSILSVVARAQAADGRLVLAQTCHASERDLALGLLVDLLTGAPDSTAVLDMVLPDPTRPAALDPLRLRLEVLAWLERLAERRPVVVIVDDVQWCDDSSLSVLGFVAHRIAGSAVSILVAARGDAAPASLAAHPAVALPPLADPDARALLRRAGLDVDAIALPAVLERAAGNPLALLELGRAAAADDGVDVVPSSVEAAFGVQLSALPTATRVVLLLASACDGDLRVLGRVIDPQRLLADLAPAEIAGLVGVTDHTVRFRHPLVRSAAYSLATAVDRHAAHARLAEAYADDPERRAWHRAEATVVPDEGVAVDLVEAADLAMRRGAGAEGARLLARAADLTPERSARHARLLDAIYLNNGVGNFEWTVEVAPRLVAEADDPVTRARAGQLVAYALGQTDRAYAARDAVVEVLEPLVELAPLWGWSSLTTLAVLGYRGGWPTDELAAWVEVFDRASGEAAERDPVIRASRAWLRVQMDPHTRPREVLDLIAESPLGVDSLGQLAATHEMLLGATAWILHETPTALERLRRSLDLMRRVDAPGEMAQTLTCLALVQIAAGEYDAADAAGRLLLDIAEARNQTYASVESADLRSRVAALRGEVDRARELCAEARLATPAGEAVALELNLRTTMSFVRTVERNPSGAWEEIRPLFLEDGEARHPHVSYRELGHFVAAAHRAGADGTAAVVLAVAERRLSDPGPFHRLQLARSRALLAGEDAEPHHREAVGIPEAVSWPFDLANARLELGAWLRRRHRQSEARVCLQEALHAFETLGVRPWAEFARTELRAAGVATEPPAPSAWSGLTAQEREVVQLAASGRTNPEIAAALYLSPRTVSTHLYNAFPKLGVTSRAQLRDVVPEST